jgi:hypothetical protein
MDGSTFYRNDRSSSNRPRNNRNNNTPSPSTTTSSSNSFATPENNETPLSGRQQRQENAIASSLSACQAQLANVLKKLEETTGALVTLSGRIERVEQKLETSDEDANIPAAKGKRKRPKDSLTIQRIFFFFRMLPGEICSS